MIDRFLVALSNAVYFVPTKVREFRKKHPGVEVIIACATKGRKLAKDQNPQYEYGWSFARRNTLILAETGFYCGDWEISLQSISEAILVKIPSGAVLKIATAEGVHYQFGLQSDPKWEN